jgi:hypothetical protein
MQGEMPLDRAGFFGHLTFRRGKWSNPLALAGFHPYNPLTGIMVKPQYVSRRPIFSRDDSRDQSV